MKLLLVVTLAKVLRIPTEGVHRASAPSLHLDRHFGLLAVLSLQREQLGPSRERLAHQLHLGIRQHSTEYEVDYDCHLVTDAKLNLLLVHDANHQVHLLG